MDFLLKQRLTGAVVLVALGVIFIPMLLEGPGTVVPEMEPFPQAKKVEPVRPLKSFPPADAVPEEPQQSVLMTATDTAPDKAEPEPEAPPPEPAAPETQTPAEAPASVKAPAIRPAPKSGPLSGWVVQVGSFSSEKNALGLRDRLRKAGYATQVEKAHIGGKVHYRVRVGPFLEKTQAESIRGELEKKMKLQGRVLSG